MLGTHENWCKWSDIVAAILMYIISCEIKYEDILSTRVFEWLP